MSPETETSGAGGDPLIEETVDGRFRLDERLGEGAVGRVYKATQLSIDRPVALKVLHGDFRRDSEFQQRFQREAKVISGFNHPNIVRLVDFGEDEEHGFTYLVMEYIEGIELLQLVQKGRLDPRFALEITNQLCAGLMAAHEQDIVHRDLKAENVILVSVPGGIFQAKVLDFGVAFPTESNVRLTSGREIFGTPAYMSPEQTEANDVDPTSDLYSLGVLLFEMITGELPFEAESSMRMMVKHFEKDPPNLGDRLPEEAVPEGLNELVQELMAKDPSARPPSSEVVRQRLESIRELNGWSSLRVDSDRPLEEVFADWIVRQGDPHAEGALDSRVSSEDFAIANTVVAAAGALNDSERREALPSERARSLEGGEPETAIVAPDERGSAESTFEHTRERHPEHDTNRMWGEETRISDAPPGDSSPAERTSRPASEEESSTAPESAVHDVPGTDEFEPPADAERSSPGETRETDELESSWDPPPEQRDPYSSASSEPDRTLGSRSEAATQRLDGFDDPDETDRSEAASETREGDETSRGRREASTWTGGANEGRGRIVALGVIGLSVLAAVGIVGYMLVPGGGRASGSDETDRDETTPSAAVGSRHDTSIDREVRRDAGGPGRDVGPATDATSDVREAPDTRQRAEPRSERESLQDEARGASPGTGGDRRPSRGGRRNRDPSERERTEHHESEHRGGASPSGDEEASETASDDSDDDLEKQLDQYKDWAGGGE